MTNTRKLLKCFSELLNQTFMELADDRGDFEEEGDEGVDEPGSQHGLWQDNGTYPGVMPALGVDAGHPAHIFGEGQSGFDVRTPEDDEVAYLGREDVAQQIFLAQVEEVRLKAVMNGNPRHAASFADSETRDILVPTAERVTGVLNSILREEGPAGITEDMDALVPPGTSGTLLRFQ